MINAQSCSKKRTSRTQRRYRFASLLRYLSKRLKTTKSASIYSTCSACFLEASTSVILTTSGARRPSYVRVTSNRSKDTVTSLLAAFAVKAMEQAAVSREPNSLILHGGELSLSFRRSIWLLRPEPASVRTTSAVTQTRKRPKLRTLPTRQKTRKLHLT